MKAQSKAVPSGGSNAASSRSAWSRASFDRIADYTAYNRGINHLGLKRLRVEA
ncbi:MAG: hypothetical protein WCJ67_04760 [Thermoleophilia bacterium]